MLKRALFIIICVGLTALLPLFFMKGDDMPLWLAMLTYRVGTSWLIFFMYFLLCEFALLVFFLIIHFILPPERRKLVRKRAYLIVTVFIVLLLIYGNVHYHNIARVEYTVKTEKDIGERESLKIVALADLHLGYAIGRGELAHWIDLINAEKPDIVLFVGDIVDAGTRPLFHEKMAEEFLRIEAPLGVYGVYGNHEYYHPIGVEKFYEDAGITLLVDQWVDAGDFYVIGRDDYTNGSRRFIPQAREYYSGLTFKEAADPSRFAVVLDHQPREFDGGGFVNIQISGHTHGGQVWPVSLVLAYINRLSHGRETIEGIDVFVTSGIGVWGGKFRIGTDSEYIVINVVK